MYCKVHRLFHDSMLFLRFVAKMRSKMKQKTREWRRSSCTSVRYSRWQKIPHKPRNPVLMARLLLLLLTRPQSSLIVLLIINEGCAGGEAFPSSLALLVSPSRLLFLKRPKDDWGRVSCYCDWQ